MPRVADGRRHDARHEDDGVSRGARNAATRRKWVLSAWSRTSRLRAGEGRRQDARKRGVDVADNETPLAYREMNST